MNVVVSTLNAKYIHTSLALRYLKSYCAPEFNLQMAEYTIKDPVMNIVSDLYSYDPDVIGFSCYIWNIEETIPIIEMLKKIKPEIKIVLGGPEVSYDVPQWLERLTLVDYIIVGEGEETFKDFLTALRDENDPEEVKGLAFLKDGRPHRSGPRPKLDLKSVPSPFRFEEDLSQLSKRVTYIETSRGCPYSCAFCLSSIEVGVRYFDIEMIKEEIRFLMNNGARTIKFVDRTFNIRRDYALEMFEFLIEEHLPNTVFQFEITADIMRPEVIDYLNEHAPVGLFRFEIGVQSTNDATNELVERRQNFDKLKRTVTTVRDGGKIVQHLDLIAGLPEENYDSFRQTFNDVFDFRIEEVQLGFLKMLRGTGLRLRADQHDYIYMDQAPYEILGNNVLTFDEIIKIKRVEDVLEKFWNDHRMDTTVTYLIDHVFPTAFDFFQQFGDYWERSGWSRIGHQLEDLFKRLHSFLSERNIEGLPAIEGLMKYDYFIRQKHKPRKPWWDYTMDRQTQSACMRFLALNPEKVSDEFAGLQLTEKELHKHVMIESIPFDLETYLEDGVIKNRETLLIMYFDPKAKKTSAYTIANELININEIV
ncbi:B12-binding domain-containing radical SAM protein [Pseudalkalibacillus berkeleyi]|uniref:B12-binding domain-containing radical SAM protein n=1 Tax=Pseudalkalibacillus berkeleyi TaxID=1069813 RepID=A0ABS9GZ19_9BACL|nr:B12-binding domain-containing radical SAM protein [Pseudalkalibacillus berkeleyi]MCF6136777.1 B12-binding domain-containing radical SAM protein [Pseudalkalibacillus berkeleyi]